MPDTVIRFVDPPAECNSGALADLRDALEVLATAEFAEQLAKARRSGLGAPGRAPVARDLSRAALRQGSAQVEEAWARSYGTTRLELLEAERDLTQGELTGHLHHYLQAFRDGHRSKGSTLWYVQRDLRQTHELQFVRGLEAAGKFRTPTAKELRFLQRLRLRDFGFLRKFLDDVAAGRGTMDYTKRMALYALGGQAAYWAGFVFGTTRGKCIRWVLGPAEHCESCQHLAEGGPWKNGIYYRSDFLRMHVYPKSHTLRCYRGCKCRLEAVDKPGRRPGWKAPYRRVKRKEGT